MQYNRDEAVEFLTKSGIFFDPDDLEEDGVNRGKNIINLNDAFFWACADCEEVLDSEVQEVANLFFKYGWNGITYWVCEKRGYDKVEFLDVNRGLEFVRHEEALIKKTPRGSARAFVRLTYTIGKET